MIERFLKWANIHECAGEWVSWQVFLDEFHKYLAYRKADPASWPEERIKRALGRSMPVGRGPGNRKIVCNVSREFAQPRRWVVDADGNARLEAPYLKIAS